MTKRKAELERACEAMEYAPGFVPEVEQFCFYAMGWLQSRCVTFQVTTGASRRKWMVAANWSGVKSDSSLEISPSLSLALARAVLKVKGKSK